MNNKLKLFTCCHLVSGPTRTAILDFQRKMLFFIPNALSEILINFKHKTLENILENFEYEQHKIIHEYFDYLESNELIFWTDIPEQFPDINLDFRIPSIISNAIIEVKANSFNNIENVLNQLEDCFCSALEIRIIEVVDLIALKNILVLLNDSIIEVVDIYLRYKLFKKKELRSLFIEFPRLNGLVFFGSEKEEINKLNGIYSGNIIYTSQQLNNLHCGIVSKNYFSLDINTFTESLSNNSCLNLKISIDSEGNIKNCPSMPESFGNIKDTTIAEAIEKPGFKKYWNITKDQIAVCKDCEFRYICTDCRAYKEDPEDDYSKPLKCGYDPYTGVWSEWSTNPLKQKAIQYYGMEEIIKQE